MINYQFNLAVLSGMALMIFAPTLIVMGLFYRPFQPEKLVQDIVLALLYLISGAIWVFSGWRFNPIMQFSILPLVVSIVYLCIKDHRR
jgi:Ycf66 protein N-terminus